MSRPGVTSPTPEAHGSLGSFTPSAAQSGGKKRREHREQEGDRKPVPVRQVEI